jgi:putative PIN family toxin of toxin-antitoxin system
VRVVLDSTVLVAAIRSSAGASRQLLIRALERRYVLLLSVPLIVEYEAVMTRSEHLKASGLRAKDAGDLLDALVAVAEPVYPTFSWRPMLRDPDDDMVFEVAINGQADLLVTFNQGDSLPDVSQFKMALVSPREALAQMRKAYEKK